MTSATQTAQRLAHKEPKKKRYYTAESHCVGLIWQKIYERRAAFDLLFNRVGLIHGRLHKTHQLTINIYFHLTKSNLQYYGPNPNNTAINDKPNGSIYSVYTQTPFSNKLCKFPLTDINLHRVQSIGL